MSFPSPIFILACPRSYTSLICAMLGQHPELYGVPELRLFTTDTIYELEQRAKYGKGSFKMHGLRRTVAQLYAGEQTMQSIEMAHRWISNRRQCSTGEVYIELCRKVAPLRIIDKSPAYSRLPGSLNRIHKTFPNAQYIHLVRHPRTQGQSVMNINNGFLAIVTNSRDYATNPPTVDPQFLWGRTQANILEFLSTIPSHQHIRFRGEDILNEPRLHFEKLCKWLNLSWNESIFEALLHPEESPYACIGPHGAYFGNDPNFLQSPAYRYRPVAPSTLEGSLAWRKDDKGFLPLVMELAQEFGYQ
ncbi:MAG TPA: sulfotransferase [Coleofasciculaceae cyanobacterium]